MEIDLNEISTEGTELSFNEKSGELTSALKDLISSSSYEFQASIRDIGCDSYQLSGTVKTSIQTNCSRCGCETAQALSVPFNDILMDKNTLENDTESSSTTTHEVDSSAPDISYYENCTFNLGQFTHEVVALAEPYRSYCENCQDVNTDFSQPVYEENDPEFGKKRSPFSALKDFVVSDSPADKKKEK